MLTKKTAVITLFMLLVLGFTVVPANANHEYYNNPHQSRSDRGNIVQKAVIGAALGGAAGGILSNRDNRGGGAVRGALIGAVAGGAYGYVQNRRNHNRYGQPVYYNNHPQAHQRNVYYGNGYGYNPNSYNNQHYYYQQQHANPYYHDPYYRGY